MKIRKKIFLATLSFGLLSIGLPSAAQANISSLDSEPPRVKVSQNNKNTYIYAKKSTIRIQRQKDGVYGYVWKKDKWSKKKKIFVDSDNAFKKYPKVGVLRNGTIAMLGGASDGVSLTNVIAYSPKYGFTHHKTDKANALSVLHYKNSMLFVSCPGSDDENVITQTWNQKKGFVNSKADLELEGAQCDSRMMTNYFVAGKKNIVDYYSGNVYAKSDLSIIDSIDLTDIGYRTIEEGGDDYPGDERLFRNPTVFTTAKNDIVMTYEGSSGQGRGDVNFDSLYGYSHADKEWKPMVNLGDSFTLAQGKARINQTATLRTNDQKNVFAFAVNDTKTKYHVYRWTSKKGWIKEKKYEFKHATELVRPKATTKNHALHWGFYTAKNEKFRVHRWEQETGYTMLYKQKMPCESNCVPLRKHNFFQLETSAAGKIFFIWQRNTQLMATAWDPKTDVTSTVELLESGSKADIQKTRITSNGSWIIQWYIHRHIGQQAGIRWTPDGLFGQKRLIRDSVFDGDYTAGNKQYRADFDPNTSQIIVSKVRWNGEDAVITTINNARRLDKNRTIVHKGYMFVAYENKKRKRRILPVKL